MSRLMTNSVALNAEFIRRLLKCTYRMFGIQLSAKSNSIKCCTLFTINLSFVKKKNIFSIYYIELSKEIVAVILLKKFCISQLLFLLDSSFVSRKYLKLLFYSLNCVCMFVCVYKFVKNIGNFKLWDTPSSVL